jgi:Uma2 family endonuclease
MRLDADEFMRLYSATSEKTKAELIQGRVYMASPVRADVHGDPDALIQTWLGVYAVAHPQLQHSTNATVRLTTEDIPQPDASLRRLPNYGGHARMNKGYIEGPPELVVEIAASSRTYDAHDKLDSYRGAGILEYILYRTEDGELDWFALENETYVQLPVDENGVIHSRIFPGLWLDRNALLAGDGAKVVAVLQDGMKSISAS